MTNRLLALYARNRGRGLSPQIVRAEGDATLYIYDTIVASDADAEWLGGVSAESLVPRIRSLGVDTLNVRINSPGGDVFAGRAIEQALRDTRANVTVHVDGVAASAASIIAMAGNSIRIAQGAMFMIHRAWTFALGNANDLLSIAALLEKIDGTLADTYAARMDLPRDEVLALMSAETWYTAQEAVDAGLATEVMSAPATEAPQNRWDLSAYDHAPPTARAVTHEHVAPQPQHDAREYHKAFAALREHERGSLAAATR